MEGRLTVVRASENQRLWGCGSVCPSSSASLSSTGNKIALYGLVMLMWQMNCRPTPTPWTSIPLEQATLRHTVKHVPKHSLQYY